MFAIFYLCSGIENTAIFTGCVDLGKYVFSIFYLIRDSTNKHKFMGHIVSVIYSVSHVTG